VLVGFAANTIDNTLTVAAFAIGRLAIILTRHRNSRDTALITIADFSKNQCLVFVTCQCLACKAGA
jgi:hypothetical protein